jgi:4-diphosphocytidyl-2-C-methyl-D-erythritol kinase
MAVISERAPAKVNLTLEVLGRRADGYHELVSLVAFADVGDQLTLEPGLPPEVVVAGPFGAAVEGPNILDRALGLLAERAPHLALGRVRLEKSLPVSAGIGGGSADAAALLRAVRRANGDRASRIPWLEIGTSLGADVPACLGSTATWMTGIGEVLVPLAAPLPTLHAVLVYPMGAVPGNKTVRVFRALGAGPLPAAAQPRHSPALGSRQAVIDVMRARGNRLSAAALTVVPEMADVLAALEACPAVEVAGVSGAGPTCFGICPDGEAAKRACHAIAAVNRAWWVAATTLA